MAPIRRYLRITALSVLEVRIYLDNPVDAYRWLLNPRDPVLPRVIEAVRPLVMFKLREETARAKKGSKKKGVKDVVSGDDFDVSMFLTDLGSPHSILTKQKVFTQDPKLEAGTENDPLQVDENAPSPPSPPPLLQEEEDSSEEKPDLEDIPLAEDARGQAGAEDNAIAVSDDDEAEPAARAAARRGNGGDDKKKMGFRTTYDGYRIYGKILCLVVKRKGAPPGQQVAPTASGQAMMEGWIASTQAAEGGTVE